MYEQPPSSQNEQKSENATSPVGKPEPINPQTTEPATAQQLANVEREMTGFEKATLRWAKVAVIMSGLVAIFVCAQCYEMYTGGKDTRDLAVAAGKQADRTKDLVDQMTIQAGATHDLAVAAGKQADASKALVDLTAKQFTASQRLVESQRASVSVVFASVINPITFHDGGLSFVFSVTLKNNGRLAANKVKVRYTAYFSQWGKNIFSEPMERQRDFCIKPNITRDSRIALRGLTSEVAVTILPGDAKEWQINFGMGGPTDSDIFEWPPPESKLPQTKRVYPIVVGCVDYQSGVMTEPYQTGFIFEIKRSDPRMPTFIT
jgi:cell division protein FtsL